MITKLLCILIVGLTSTIAEAEERKITGTFESVRLDLLMGMPELNTGKSRDAFEKMKQTVVITEKDMTMNTGFGGGIYMTYTIQGDFLLGKTVMGKAEMYFPAYIKDGDTLFLAGQKFVRKKEESK